MIELYKFTLALLYFTILTLLANLSYLLSFLEFVMLQISVHCGIVILHSLPSCVHIAVLSQSVSQSVNQSINQSIN